MNESETPTPEEIKPEPQVSTEAARIAEIKGLDSA